MFSFALLAYGFAFRDADPSARLTPSAGVCCCTGRGNRFNESHLAAIRCRLEASYGDPLAALEYFTVAIRNYHDSVTPS